MPGRRSSKRKYKNNTRKRKPQQRPPVLWLLGLPAECLTRIVSHINSLTDRLSLENALQMMNFDKLVLWNPKAYPYEIKLNILPSGRACMKIEIEYAGAVQRVFEDPLMALIFANVCPSRLFLSIHVRVELQTDALIGCFHDCLNEVPKSFIGTKLRLYVYDDGMTDPDKLYRQVANLLRADLRSRLSAVQVFIINVRNGDEDVINQFSKRSSVVELTAPSELTFIQKDVASSPWHAVPASIKTAGTLVLAQLRELSFIFQPICSPVLISLLLKLPNLTHILCPVIYLAGTNFPHQSFDRLQRLSITPVRSLDEDRDLCNISDGECDFYRRLLVACRMARYVSFWPDIDFTIDFFNTLVHTFIATRQCSWPLPAIAFEVRNGWLHRAIYRRVRLRAPQQFIASSSDRGTLYVIRSQQPGAGNLLHFLPDVIRPVFAAVGGDIEALCVGDSRVPLPVPSMGKRVHHDTHTALFSVRLHGWPNQLFVVSFKQRALIL